MNDRITKKRLKASATGLNVKTVHADAWKAWQARETMNKVNRKLVSMQRRNRKRKPPHWRVHNALHIFIRVIDQASKSLERLGTAFADFAKKIGEIRGGIRIAREVQMGQLYGGNLPACIDEVAGTSAVEADKIMSDFLDNNPALAARVKSKAFTPTETGFSRAIVPKLEEAAKKRIAAYMRNSCNQPKPQ